MSKLTIVKPLKKMSLESLAEIWRIQKAAEDEARDARIAIEEKIAQLVPGPVEGTVTTEEGHFKIKVVRKFTRSIDPDAYAVTKARIPASLDPIEMKPALDLKRLRAIELANPELYKICAEFLTVKPAKASVSVEEV